jgi:Vitamin K epoxide reductase family
VPTMLFPSLTGAYLEIRNIRRLFKEICTRAGIQGFTLYDLRHTYASLMLMRGADPRYVQPRKTGRAGRLMPGRLVIRLDAGARQREKSQLPRRGEVRVEPCRFVGLGKFLASATSEDDEEKALRVPEENPAMSVNTRTSPDLGADAPPWDYNPSAWSQRVPICLLAGVAFLISAYMALYQWRLIDDVWDPGFGDQSRYVLDSDVSERMRGWFRVPDAAFGAIAYLGDLVFGLAGSTRRWQYRPWMVVLFGLDVIVQALVEAKVRV